MKKLQLLGLVTLSSLFIGCDLDIPPKGQIILEKEKDYTALLDYANLFNYDNQLAWYSSFDAGSMSSIVTGNGYLFSKACYLGLSDVDRTTDFKTTPLYTECYKRIARYNIVIDEVVKSDGDPKDKLRTRAEALVLRAYNYFVLVNTFAKPYNKATSSTDGGVLVRTAFSLEENPPQMTVEQVYHAIESDLVSALPHLGSKGKNVNHPGLAFANGVLAKVYLFKGEFDKAETAAKESLKHNSFIFDWVAWDLGPKPAPEIGYNNEENLYFGYGINSFTPLGFGIGPRLVSKYTPGDLRKDRFFWYTFSAFLPGCYAYREYYEKVNGVNVSRMIKFNIGGMKVSEVMLMLAECYARSNKVAEAMQIVNDLRKKRILPTKYADLVANNQEEAFNHVMDERSRELVLTPNNFYDIRRLEVEGRHQAVERILQDGAKVTVQSSSSIFIMPFPDDALHKSPNLKQNVEK
ncbi:RagB/SusD family nutrient uptake outer membrane protein [Alistipes sp. ZOR0009]|uniref:RagB/SusD family nutrient uptake outer membrane protein n=1 Tax=Alistipes sp. ZOR0009 TaxID=1339253 RepID=UPI0006468395|nr:RagB/SusD family nutrient uptake outer membrane protein [Alistipes sp. ZOR0009]